MLEINFFETDEIADELIKFAVIIAKHNGKWVFCKHKERDTYEFPGGHREAGETILEAAKRELYEETGAVDYDIAPICIYSVTGKSKINEELGQNTSYGMFYYAEVREFEKELHSEIEKIIITEEMVTNWTYPEIQPKLLEEAERRIK